MTCMFLIAHDLIKLESKLSLEPRLEHHCLSIGRRVNLDKFQASSFEDLLEGSPLLLHSCHGKKSEIQPVEVIILVHFDHIRDKLVANNEARVWAHGGCGVLDKLDADVIVKVVEEAAHEVNMGIYTTERRESLSCESLEGWRSSRKWGGKEGSMVTQCTYS